MDPARAAHCNRRLQRVDGTAATIRAHFYTLQLERQIRLDHDTRIIRVS